jgi:hypothetical protein
MGVWSNVLFKAIFLSAGFFLLVMLLNAAGANAVPAQLLTESGFGILLCFGIFNVFGLIDW